MTLEETNKPHRKHAKLARPETGEFGRNEIAIVGTTCDNIKRLAGTIIKALAPSCKIAYVDADHKSADNTAAISDTVISNGAFLEYTDKISFQRIDLKNQLTPFQKRTFFNEQDLIIVNGNHFAARTQIAVIDPAKNLEKKLDKLTDVRLILMKEKDKVLPDFIKKLTAFDAIPVLSTDDENGIITFISRFLSQRTPPLYGLVLSGGQSSRMKKDKGSLAYHGVSQREYLYHLLSKHCEKTFISCNREQAAEVAGQLPVVEDSFLNLGPTGGILSALQSNPNAAWLTVACDLPYLSEPTIGHLVQNRNPSKIATAFLEPAGEFPEPLITIWEPKSHSVLLQFLSQGYSCPRKALINSDTQLLAPPDGAEFLNVNFPEQYEAALRDLTTHR